METKTFLHIVFSGYHKVLPIPHYIMTIWGRVLYQKLKVPQLVKKYLAFYETQSSLPHSQKPTTCPYPNPDQFSPCLPITLLEDPF
jgi:hypothetical protein